MSELTGPGKPVCSVNTILEFINLSIVKLFSATGLFSKTKLIYPTPLLVVKESVAPIVFWSTNLPPPDGTVADPELLY